MNQYDFNKVGAIKNLIEENIAELNIVRNRLKRSISDLQKSTFQSKREQLEILLHDHDIKIMTLILLLEKIKRL